MYISMKISQRKISYENNMAAPKTPALSPNLGFTMGVNTSPELNMYF